MSLTTANVMPAMTLPRPQPKQHVERLEVTAAQRMVSSCSGAILTSLIMTPMDVVKVRLQAQQKPFRAGSCFVYSNGFIDCLCVCSHCTENSANGGSRASSAVKYANGVQPQPWYRRPGHFTGTLDALIKVARTEGIKALWSGLPPTLFQSVPATVVYFTMYDQLKYALGYDETKPDTKYIPIVAGCSARVIAATIINPIELIRTKMQSIQLTYRELGAAVMVTVRSEGILTMMRGLGPSLLRDVPFSAIYWFSYEFWKAQYLNQNKEDSLTFLQAFTSGALSGTLAAIVTLPFDVVKTHRQIEIGEALFGGKKRTSSTWKLIAQLYRHQGFGALYAGIVPRIIKVAPACAIMISSYEFGKAFFLHHHDNTASSV